MGSFKPALRAVVVHKRDFAKVGGMSDQQLAEKQADLHGAFKKNFAARGDLKNKAQDIYSKEIRKRRTANTFLSDKEPLG